MQRLLGIGIAGHTTHDLTVTIHPLKEMLLDLREKEGNGNDAHPWEDTGKIFHETTHGNSPAGVGDVVKEQPEGPTQGKAHKEGKGKQP